MPCIVGIDKDGNRFIACTRGSDRPRMPVQKFLADDDDGSRFAGSPWVVGAVVRHVKHGRGIIIDRNDSSIVVRFDDRPAPSQFILSLVGKAMTVEGVSDA